MSILRRVLGARVILTLVCWFTIGLVSLPTTGQAFAAGYISQQITHRTAPDKPSVCQSSVSETACWWYVKGEQTFSLSDAIVGADAEMDQAQPAVGQAADHSLAEIAVFNPALQPGQSCDACDGLEIGWIVSPNQFNGDQGPHLFIFKSVGSQFSGGCWITDNTGTCANARGIPSGWHQVSKTRTPGMTVDPTLKSQLYGIKYYNGAWWFNYQNEMIGYLLASDWPNSRFTQVMEAQWYGEVETINQPNGDCTMMGNGEYGLESGSAQITAMDLLKSNGQKLSAQASPSVSDPLLYGMGNVTSPFNSFHYGGYGTCTDFSTLKPTSGPSGTPLVVQGSWLSADPGDQICAFWDTGGGAPISCAYLNQNHSFTINFTVPANQSTGQHTVDLEDMYHSTLQDNLTFTVTSGGPKPWDCSKLSVPAIAFYDGQNFTPPEICFEGSGFLNLSDYGWANRAESINVGVHTGCFYDGPNGTGNSWCFSGSFTKSTLGTWNNRIVSFRIT